MFLRKKVYQKLYLILGQILIFSFIYYFLKDEEFGGINVVQELIREEIVKKHLEDELPESFQNYPGQQQITNLDPRSERELEKETTQVVKETTQEIKEIDKQMDSEREAGLILDPEQAMDPAMDPGAAPNGEVTAGETPQVDAGDAKRGEI